MIKMDRYVGKWDWLSPILGKCIAVAAILAALAPVAGCGAASGSRNTAHLSGNVTIDGQPPPDDAWGTINFRATERGQAPSTSATITNGKYDCPDVPTGHVTVYIQVVQPTGRTIADSGRQIPEMRNLISSKYNIGLELEVTGDDRNHQFDLTSQESGSG